MENNFLVIISIIILISLKYYFNLWIGYEWRVSSISTVSEENVQNESNLNEDEELLNERYSESEDESEDVETIDVTNEPLYHILFRLEDDDGANLIDKIGDLTSLSELRLCQNY